MGCIIAFGHGNPNADPGKGKNRSYKKENSMAYGVGIIPGNDDISVE
jgi:hypothetical protein